MRKFLIGLGAAVVVVAAAVLIAPGFVDWNRFKPDIAAQVKAATGRELAIDGTIGLSILPSLRLTVRDARFANVTGGSVPDMARLRALDIQIRLAPLLQGRFEADSITLIEPEIVLERLADGRVNWDFAAPAAPGVRPPGAPAVPEPAAAPASGRSVRLDNLRIRQGTVVWRDAAAKTEERITGLTVQLEVRSLNGPFQARGELTAHGVPLSVEAAIGEFRPTAAATVNLTIGVPGAEARAELSGAAVIVGATPRFTGKLNVSGKDLRRLIAAVGGRGAETLPAMLAQPYLLKAALKGTETGGSIDDLELDLGVIHASGSATASFRGRPRVDAKLRVTRIDLDAMLTAPAAAPASGRPAPASAAPSAAPAAKPAAAAAPFALPDIDATLDAELSAVTYNRQNIRTIALKASMAAGRARIDRLSLFLPGGGEATVTGLLAAQDGKPVYQGRIDAQVDNLRGLLAWVGADVEAIPSARLRKAALSADISGNDDQVNLLGAKISVDTTRIDGGVTLALRERPAFGATVNIDTLDLDAYAPAPGAAPPSRSPAGGSAAAGAGQARATAAGPLAALAGFDANLRLKVGRLTARQVPVRNVDFDGTLVGGVLTVRNASVGDIAGARAAVAGTLGNLAAIPVFKGTVTADAKDIGGVLRLAGLTSPGNGRALGAMKLRGRADAQADRVSVDFSLDAAGAAIGLKGQASGLGAAPRVDATLTAAHGSLAGLMRTLGADAPARDPGPFDLAASLKGGLDRLAASVRLKAAGGTLTSTGTIANVMAAPAFDLAIDATHPAVGDLAKVFAPDYRPAGGRIGPLKLSASLKGANSDYALSGLAASAGNIALRGNGRLSTKGARPVLTAALTAGDIDLNPFLPSARARSSGRAPVPAPGPSAGAPPTRPAAASDRFSSQPFDLAGLSVMDADLSVAAKSLTWRQFRVDGPTIKGTLADGLLTLSELAGRMFDGAFRLAGRLDARRTPALDGTVTVEKANVGKALLQTTEFDIGGGITDFTLRVAGAGASPRVMVGSLSGSGKIASRDGVVKGFNLQAVSDRLKNLDKAIDFLSLFSSSMGGGQTRFSRLDGTFDIKNGVIRSNDLKLAADAGAMTAAGYADLPRWHMDFNGEFHLTEHPKAPPFGMRAVGPLDDPRRFFRIEQLQAYLFQRGIGTLLRKAFPDRDRQQTPTSQPPPQQQQQQQKKPRLEDILPGLLKGLGR